MNYQAFTNDSLTMMYEGTRGALASDDALSGLGEEPRFRVRETSRVEETRCGYRFANAQARNGLRDDRLVRESAEAARNWQACATMKRGIATSPGERCKPAPALPQSRLAAREIRPVRDSLQSRTHGRLS
jgi:hypothetical protein